ncbi:MAG: hypothetical protein ACE5GE_10220, partial [Phycisphaerae bacterium]
MQIGLLAALGLALLANVACSMLFPPKPVPQSPQPRLAAATDRQINLFGELPNSHGAPYQTRMGLGLRRHTFTEEGADFDPDIDPAGARMVFASTRHQLQPDLYVKATDGVAVTQFTADPAADVQPVYSPDGSRIAFASDRSGNFDIWITDVRGGQPIQVTSAQAHEVCPSWSPDGKSLVYCKLPSNTGQWELWLADAAAGGNQRFIGYGLFPEWSPVGNTIVYQRARQRGTRWFSVWTLELVDGEPRYPTEIAASSEYALILPTWSSDGQYIAYCAVTATAPAPGSQESPTEPAMPNGPADLWLVNADGSSRTRLTDGMGASFSPVFSPDGRIYFTTTRNGMENVWSLLPVIGTGTSVADRGSKPRQPLS